MSDHEKVNAPANAAKATSAADSHPKSSPEQSTEVDTTEDSLEGLKVVMLDSAELATRSAHLAVGAGEHMSKVTKDLEKMILKQSKQALILLSVAGGLMIIAATIFAAMTISLKSRISQLDTMVSAVGKRVTELDSSMELVGSVNEGLQEMVSKQDDLTKMQGSLEARLNEAIKHSESVPEKTAQQVGEKGQVLANQVKSLEGRLAQQAKALSTLSSQMNGLQGSVGEAGGFKKEMESLARLQRERQASENAAAEKLAAQTAAANNSANLAAAAATRQRERMVQYPRIQQEVSPSGASGVLSSKP
jgi:myosin heavy subunit